MNSPLRKALVTGGAGFIGGHLVRTLIDQGVEVVVLDNLRTGNIANIEGMPVRFIHGSITDREAVRDAVTGCDAVFHLAALVSVPESMERVHECVSLNVTGLLIVLEEAAAAGVRKLVLSSSAAIYGDDPIVPKREEMRPAPKSPYAITKLDGEYYCALFNALGRIETTALRYFNVFGPRQNPKSAYAAAVPIFIRRALNGQDVVIHGDGGQTRDFVFVKDVVAANIFAASTVGMTGVFNVGYGQSVSIGELAARIIAQTGGQSTVVNEAPRAGDVRHSLASADRLFAAGFVPGHSLETGLVETLAWYRENADPI